MTLLSTKCHFYCNYIWLLKRGGNIKGQMWGQHSGHNNNVIKNISITYSYVLSFAKRPNPASFSRPIVVFSL